MLEEKGHPCVKQLKEVSRSLLIVYEFILIRSAEPIICRKVDALSDENGPMYEAIVIPQKVDGRVPFLEYVTDKVSYLAEEAFSLKPGMCYNYVMTISNSPQSIVINIGGSIEDWN